MGTVIFADDNGKDKEEPYELKNSKMNQFEPLFWESNLSQKNEGLLSKLSPLIKVNPKTEAIPYVWVGFNEKL